MAQQNLKSGERAPLIPRVTMMCHRYHPFPGGGADRQAQRIAEKLAAQGWRMLVLTPRLPGTKRQELLNGVRVRRLVFSQIPKTQAVLLSLDLMRRLLFAPRQVVHLNQMYREILPALVARRLRGSPIVIRTACGGAFGDIARLQQVPAGKLMLRLARRADAIISLSKQITDELLEHGFDAGRVVEIPNGVDIRRYSPASLEEKQRLRADLRLPQVGPLVIFTGRLHYQKGIDVLIRAWEQVWRVHPRAHLVLLGEDQEGGKLQKLAGDLGIERSVHFLGHIEPALPYLRAADLFVLPSFFEGLSNALLEAMACGLPVITTNIGGTCEVIRPGLDGLLVEPGDQAALAERLIDVLGDEALAERLSRQARQRVEEEYTADRTAARYAALYARLAGYPQPLPAAPGLQTASVE